uniref:Ankyrin repeat domain-containing protein n=1 Tax=Euplotes harpa TaxID=151035 RepID=A0A7S3N5I6_9SPIT|mmetsp:Transcript_13601/g.15777  ORF Transcript_13601/g.15777 Transcript_13601/m.15777 type:complete len:158 (+) Transcript_13601:391-864(+)
MILSIFNDKEEGKEDVEKLCSEVKTTLQESLLHLAVVHYVEKQDDRYMRMLCKIHFPLYEEDQNGDIPAFALSLCSTDAEFTNGLQVLLDGGYYINYSNSAGKDLIEFLSEFSITPDRVKFMKKQGLAPRNKKTVISNIENNSELSDSKKEEIIGML